MREPADARGRRPLLSVIVRCRIAKDWPGLYQDLAVAGRLCGVAVFVGQPSLSRALKTGIEMTVTDDRGCNGAVLAYGGVQPGRRWVENERDT